MIDDVVIDELIRSKRKTVSLTVTREARLVVRAPLRLPVKEIEKLVQTKKNWIINKKKQVRDRLESLEALKVSAGRSILFMGRHLAIQVSPTVLSVTQVEGTLWIPSKYRGSEKQLVEKWYKEQAKSLLAGRIRELSSQTGIPYKELRITSARRRWGSCNSLNCIHLTWRLIMAESRPIDYVIIHELCHVIYKNHSQAFWDKVGQLMPDYKAQRHWLKEHAYILDIPEVF